ncbi:pre-mRNA-processing factor 39-2 isoform X3 [Rhododendron vialii]|uniref:pre-mRNA-processing factor 39-2 isoform X3 n=1 Tax=Rhododendron vialii TaxID=182163 RepID=UPI00265EB303|nr:pre-mRNA-processing factor 39-2 isoform X3 [Rhododendron vialii]
MELQVYTAAKGLSAAGEEESQGYNLLAPSQGFDEQLQELMRRGSLDFDTWTSIISKIEKIYPDDIEKICLVYDSFLSEFPLCHGYWRKFAAHRAHLCTIDKVVETFERAVRCATYCVGVWVEYCSFGMVAYEDPSDIRSFKKFAAILEAEMERHENHSAEIESESVNDAAFTALTNEISSVINNLLDPSTGYLCYRALQIYKSIGERFYQEACELESKISSFEKNIGRPYFHVIPLDDNQLENWHHYLDFVEMQEDFDWAVKLYERCLIPCADYPEFWMRYVEFMEAKGGRELANFALDRATEVFLKNVPAIHLFNSRFKEKIGDRCGARAAFLLPDKELNSDFVEKVVKEANMEKRLGNFTAASSVYEKALAMAAERQKLHSVAILYIHFSHLKYMMTGSVDAARDVIIDGIQHVPHCKLLLEGLIYFLMMHGGVGQVNVVEPIITDAISPVPVASQGLGAKDREDISVLYLQFVDQCGTVHEIIKAWNQHIKLFPHLLRTTSSKKLPTSGTQLLDKLTVKPCCPSGGHTSDQLNQLQMQEQKVSLPENHPIHPNQVFTSQIQPEENNNCAQERSQQVSPKIAEQCMEDESIVNKPTHDVVHQSGDDACGHMESTPYSVHQAPEAANEPVGPARVEDECRPIVPTHGLLHSPGEDAYETMDTTHGLVENTTQPAHDLVHQVANVDSFSEASQKYTDSIKVEQELDHEPKQHAKPFPLDALHLNSQEKRYWESTPMSSSEQQSPTYNRPENCQKAKGSRCTLSTGSSISSDSAQIQNETLKHSSGDTRSGFHGDSENQQNQQWRVSPQKQRLPAEINAQMVSSGGDSDHPLPAQNPLVQRNSTTHSSPPQNLQQQSFVSEHQSLPQAQMAQFPMPSGGQYGNTAYIQEYNQMMENYFRQLQHMIAQQHYEYQQQFMQQVQQQQVQQPYQQQQQQQLYLQQQQQLAQLYYQQLPQLQGQQAQLMQQQQQFYHQFMQPHDQNPMQQQQAYQQHQQMQHHQQITSPQIPTWNGSYYHQQSSSQHFGSSHSGVEPGQQFVSQVQQVISPHSASASESLDPQQISQGITPPHPPAASGSAVSPHNQLQPSHGGTPHGAGASRPSSSPYNQQQLP